MKPLIFAKSAMNLEAATVKEEIGCDGVEIQLLDELLPSDTGEFKFADEVFDLFEMLDVNIRAVHAPLNGGYTDLENLVSTKGFNVLNEVVRIADLYGKPNQKTLVVLHTRQTLETFKRIGSLWESVVSHFNMLLHMYKNTEIVIENIIPVFGMIDGRPLQVANNFGFDNVDIVRELRKECNTDRIGTCLDVCHARMSHMVAKLLYTLVNSEGNYTLPRYFIENAEFCKLIHLSDLKNAGLKYEDHGVSFEDTEDSKEILRVVKNLYTGLNYKCPITLEIVENDYMVSDQYAKSKKLFDRVWDE